MRSRLPAACAALLAGLALTGPAPVAAQAGGAYSLTWQSVSGGGGNSSGGAYQVACAIGQVDAAALVGGSYALNGGYFSPPTTGPLDAPANPLPRAFAFRLPAPNPGRGGATFAVELPGPAHLTLTLHSVDGRLVRTLVDGERGAGVERIAWDGRTESGSRAAPGVYFARVQAGNASAAHRFVLLD